MIGAVGGTPIVNVDPTNTKFGTGKVDFAGVFKAMKAAGFKGPIMVEGVKVGATPEETAANAKANRETAS
jgi:sugar phosphate isomerase/epimerase